MRKIIFAIFAHPDDESFGPSGYLLSERKNGCEVNLVTLTLGEAGQNPDNFPNLGEVRKKEWHKAGELIGAKSMTHLGYQDGQLNNNDMIKIGYKLVELIKDKVADQDEVEIEIVTNDLNGISGHIDHMVAARAAAWAFYTLKANDNRFKQILLSCITNEQAPNSNIDWLYMEPGRDKSEINLSVDVRRFKNEIIEIMRAHNTQRQDCETHLKNRGDNIGLYNFIVLN